VSTWKRFAFTLFALAGLAACDRSVITAPDYHQSAPNVLVLGSAGSRVEIKFRENLAVRLDVQGRLRSNRGTSLAALQAVLDRHNAAQVRPLLSVSGDRLVALTAEAHARSAAPVPDMASWHELVLLPGTDVERALVELRARPEVEHAYVAPEPVPLPVTPDFTSDQNNYFGPAPSGTETVYARSLAGGRGAGVQLVDLEYDWHFEHEDLGLSPSILITGERWSAHGSNHGTAVLGILRGRDNGFGITGGAPDATLRVASPMFNGWYKPADAITSASAQMVAGDVLLLEQQTRGPATDTAYVPLEWIPSVYDAILLATQAGRVVIEAAGNGGRDLDSPLYAGRFDRNQFNSGAIIVGAGDGANARRSFSNYGSRVDVQAHGTAVTTTGYGDLSGSTENDQYTAAFNGTSSASAIVAAAATVLQGYLKHHARPVLTSLGMADLLKTTGSPQTGTTSQQIGPKPNLRAAITHLNMFPDLIVDGLKHAPSNPTTADVMQFTAVVKNIGRKTAPPSTLELRIGGETPGAPQTRLAIPALEPGQSFAVARQLRLGVAQNYRNTATADVTGAVAESNEMNNMRTDDYTVTAVP